jgi:hypothetical protein
MTTFNELANEFLAQENIAIVGVSRNSAEAANLIYKTLRGKGYKVYPVNPSAETIEGDKCYPDLKSIPARLDGVFMMTRPEVSEQIVRQCIELAIPRVWMHENAFAGAANTSVSAKAVEDCQANGIKVIAGGCPMMFLEFGHKCMRWIMGMMGRLPA